MKIYLSNYVHTWILSDFGMLWAGRSDAVAGSLPRLKSKAGEDVERSMSLKTDPLAISKKAT